MVCRDFILPEPASYVFFYAIFNLRNLLYIIVAAYRQYNPSITYNDECYLTGRLKRDYGVQHMIRRLTKSEWYFEKHNAAYDAEDELMIMQLIGYPADWYPSL